MSTVHPDQFLGLPGCNLSRADAVLASMPVEMTVSYGRGTGRAPRAILEASCQIETFDEETLVDFDDRPRVHTLPPLTPEGTLSEYLDAARRLAQAHRDRFFLSIGGEHTLSYAAATGLSDDLSKLTVVQIDAHADLIDRLEGERWSHGTVMRRLWDEGCKLVQIGVRSLSREEYELATSDERITTFFAHRMADEWGDLLDVLRGLGGDVYLTVDVDGLDPAVIPSTGTPQPGGLTWPQMMELLRAVTSAPGCRLIGGDVVEFVPSPHSPGCDLSAAKLVAKMLAWWWTGRAGQR
jgi:agmatinase